MSYVELIDNKLYCTLCPNACLIQQGNTGRCSVRFNRHGVLDLPFYGRISSLAIDPIEKKPLYHFHPGHTILSVGFWGCSLRCPFCQNHGISMKAKHEGYEFAPDDLLKYAIKQKSFGIAYTYSEPLVHFEYVLKTAKEAKALGIKNILVTNGYLNIQAAEELLEWIDAVNIDLKAFSEDFYSNELKGKLQPVLEFIQLAAERCHVEITTLVIPGKNDTEKEILAIADFIAGIDKNIPWHLSCYYPQHKYTIPATAGEKVIALKDLVGDRLNFVYTGNSRLGDNNTYCPGCGMLLIRRSAYQVEVSGIQGKICARCKTVILH